MEQGPGSRPPGRPRGRTVGEAISVRVPPEDELALRRICEAQGGRAIASLIRQAVHYYLADHPDEAMTA